VKCGIKGKGQQKTEKMINKIITTYSGYLQEYRKYLRITEKLNIRNRMLSVKIVKQKKEIPKE
jgi:hypothetical protein